MPKGIFGTPRPVGTVDEIIVEKTIIRLIDGEYDINATLLEGNDNAGTFEAVEGGGGFIRIKKSDLSVSDQVFFDNFLKVIISEYVGDKGYSGVVIT